MALLAATGPWLCSLCGGEMWAWQKLHLHHSDPTAALMGLPGDQLVHAACNMRDGGQRGAAITNSGATPGRPGRASRIW